MSASLDDMEPYEIFQQELDHWAREYEVRLLKNESTNKAQYQVSTIHSFIEFVCFHKSIDNLEALSSECIMAEFAQFLCVGQIELKNIEKIIEDFLI
ncbi:MAG TPA: hypothetical protein VIK89_11280, partial [Cytophagaceae bacterium]